MVSIPTLPRHAKRQTLIHRVENANRKTKTPKLRPSSRNVNTPGPQHLDDLGRDGRGQRHANENQALVNRIGESHLCPYAWNNVSN